MSRKVIFKTDDDTFYVDADSWCFTGKEPNSFLTFMNEKNEWVLSVNAKYIKIIYLSDSKIMPVRIEEKDS